MAEIDSDLWSTIQSSIPIVCVDVVLARRDAAGQVTQIGLVRRFDAAERATTWCHIGGRMQLGESISEAVLRHVRETVKLDISQEIGLDPQPNYVQQYFTAASSHPELPGSGVDSRKHAVALSFLVTAPDETVKAVPGSEGLEFSWFNVEQLRALTDIWPGSMEMVHQLLKADRS